MCAAICTRPENGSMNASSTPPLRISARDGDAMRELSLSLSRPRSLSPLPAAVVGSAALGANAPVCDERSVARSVVRSVVRRYEMRSIGSVPSTVTHSCCIGQ